jgi:glycosyltransferase involved in cell wall biosynthesis
MKVLFIHCSGSFGGASKSLIELYKQLRLNGAVDGTVIGPRGSCEEKFKEVGFCFYGVFGLTQFDNTRFGYYRGLRWLILLREFLFIIPTIIALLKVKKEKRHFDIIHANEITVLPVALVAKLIFKCPLIVHVRSVQQNDCSFLRTRVIHHLLKKYANHIIAIDDTVLASLPNVLPVIVIRNGLFFKDPVELQLSNKNVMPCVGIVGSLLRLKGVYEFMEAARYLILEKGIQVKFVVVGDNVRSNKGLKAWLYKKFGFSEDVMTDIKLFVERYQLEQYVEIHGFIADLRAIYSRLDILCFPSYLNAVGRPVFEAALFGIPSIAAVKNPMPDTIVHKVTGLCITEPESQALADAIEYLIKNMDERKLMGINAYHLALNNFDMKKNGKQVFELYQKLLCHI